MNMPPAYAAFCAGSVRKCLRLYLKLAQPLTQTDKSPGLNVQSMNEEDDDWLLETKADHM